MATFKSDLLIKRINHRGIYDGKQQVVSGAYRLKPGVTLTTSDLLQMVPLGENTTPTGVILSWKKVSGTPVLTGGTFSISNGGVFGSMLSTPIINPPQSAILGIHATKDRAVVEDGQIVVRPINYLALSYDHRIIDGREAVLSLVTIKEALEDPARMLLGI